MSRRLRRSRAARATTSRSAACTVSVVLTVPRTAAAASTSSPSRLMFVRLTLGSLVRASIHLDGSARYTSRLNETAARSLAVRTRCPARQRAPAGSGLPPTRHVRRAESTRRWERRPPRVPEAPTYQRTRRRSTESSTSAVRLLVVGSHPGNSMPAALRIRLRTPSQPMRYSARSDWPSDSSTSTPVSSCANPVRRQALSGSDERAHAAAFSVDPCHRDTGEGDRHCREDKDAGLTREQRQVERYASGGRSADDHGRCPDQSECEHRWVRIKRAAAAPSRGRPGTR